MPQRHIVNSSASSFGHILPAAHRGYPRPSRLGHAWVDNHSSAKQTWSAPCHGATVASCVSARRATRPGSAPSNLAARAQERQHARRVRATSESAKSKALNSHNHLLATSHASVSMYKSFSACCDNDPFVRNDETSGLQDEPWASRRREARERSQRRRSESAILGTFFRGRRLDRGSWAELILQDAVEASKPKFASRCQNSSRAEMANSSLLRRSNSAPLGESFRGSEPTTQSLATVVNASASMDAEARPSCSRQLSRGGSHVQLEGANGEGVPEAEERNAANPGATGLGRNVPPSLEDVQGIDGADLDTNEGKISALSSRSCTLATPSSISVAIPDNRLRRKLQSLVSDGGGHAKEPPSWESHFKWATDVFKSLDTDDNRNLSRDEFATSSKFLDSMRQLLGDFVGNPSHLADFVVRHADADNNGTVSLGEFQFLTWRMAEMEKYPSLEADFFFSAFDKDGDGMLNLDELQSLQHFMCHRNGLPADALNGIFEEVDKNGDGVLTLAEYTRWCAARAEGNED